MAVKYEGPEVIIGGIGWTCAPLNFKAIKKFAPFLLKMEQSGAIPYGDIEAIADLVFASLSRNHADVTQEFLMENLDLSNIKGVLDAVMKSAGGKVAEAPKPGE